VRGLSECQSARLHASTYSCGRVLCIRAAVHVRALEQTCRAYIVKAALLRGAFLCLVSEILMIVDCVFTALFRCSFTEGMTSWCSLAHTL
jgi:hypothetical protein